MSLSVAAIIPAHNEQETIARVIEPLVASKLVDEVFVISDGSTDQTVSHARAAGAHVHEFSKKGGKGEAMLYAVAHTQADILLFLDADLIGLDSDHIERLLLPVIHGARLMNIGLLDRGSFWMKFWFHLPLMSGQRAVRRTVFESVSPEFMHGYMVETSLNYYCRTHKLSYGAVVLPGLTFRNKYAKVSWPRAVVQYLKMSGEVFQAMLAVRLARLFRRF